jgi:hypothetical protein
MMTDPPPELPPWVVMQSQNPVLASVLKDLFKNERFRAAADSVFAPQGGEQFPVFLGDHMSLEQMNATRPRNQRVQPSGREAAVSAYATRPDQSIDSGGLFVNVDKIHETLQQDSAAARLAVRDALLHEFGHLFPVAEQRHARAITGDPKRNDRNAAQHPVMQSENRLRGLFDLPAKTFYGLQEGK